MATQTFTHLYDTYEDAIRTVQALEGAGVAHDNISLVGNNADNRAQAATVASTGSGSGTGTVTGTGNGTGSGTGTRVGAGDTAATESRSGTGASLGTVVGGGAGLLAGLGALAIPGVGPVVAAGWLIATLTGAGIGAAGGGLLGSLVHAGVPEEHAHTYAEGVRRGGTLVTVRADDSQAATIQSILDGRNAVDVTARGAEYRQSGWERFDDQAPAYTSGDLEAERLRRTQNS